MFNEENASDAKNLHVDSFKYQSTEDMPSDAYSSWEEKHPNARVFKLERHGYDPTFAFFRGGEKKN